MTETVTEEKTYPKPVLTEGVSVSDRTMIWDGIGFATPKAKTAAQAIREAELDWDVELRPLGMKNAKGTGWKSIPYGFAAVRTDNDEALGTVGRRYEPIQNRDVFGWLDNLVDDSGAKYESAWSTKGGRQVGLTMKFPDDVLVGGEDPHNMYLFVRTNHDGSGACKVALSMVRMSCTNMANTILRDAKASFSIPHIGGWEKKLQAAREALEISFAYRDAMQDELEAMLASPLWKEKKTRENVEDVFSNAGFGERATFRHTDLILQNLESSPTIGDDQRNTRYGLFQAGTEYLQWHRTRRDDEGHFNQQFAGETFRAKQALHELCAS